MKPARSIRLRGVIGAALWLAVGLVTSDLILTGLFNRYVDRQFDQRLEAYLHQMTAVIASAQGVEERALLTLANPRFRRPYSGLYWQVEGRDRLMFRSRSLWDAEISWPQDAIQDGGIRSHDLDGPNGQSLRVLERSVILAGGAGRWRLAVAEDRAGLERNKQSFARTLAISFSILALGLIAVQLIQLYFTLRPLQVIRRALADLRAGRTKRLAGRFPTEIQPLVEDLNSLLESNERIIERTRTQVGNLAHALKTPVAILRNELGSQGKDAEQDGAQVVRSALDRIQQQVDYYLARARVAVPSQVPGALCKVAPCIKALERTLLTLYRDRNLEIEVRSHPEHGFQGDQQDLEEILGNLMDNACKWAATRVRVSSSQEDDALILTVEDDGPGIDEPEHERVLQPGTRLDEEAPGSGLGLAIVADLIELYGGQLTLARSPLGGLKVVASIPGPH